MKFLLLFLFSLSLASGQTPAELDRTLRKLAPDLVSATVAILVGQGSGSGVIVTPDGLVITAAHVTVKPGEKMTVLLADGRELDAISLGVDHSTDGALLKINAPGPFPFRPYIKEKNYAVGDFAIATGHPGGPVLGRPSPIRIGRILEAGTKSGFADPITTNATVISGDSGGPLYNLKGEVIGINSNIGMPWVTNKHVPLPSIVEKWDALMKGESFGVPSSAPTQSGDLFDEPYAGLRDQFEAALKEHSDDPLAARLLKRPRLMDPHHMQAFLDQVAPDEEAPMAPRFGLTLDLKSTQAKVASITPGGPADKAGLTAGDIIIRVDSDPINTPVALALKLKSNTPLTLETESGQSLKLVPAQVPARRHFPQPVAGLIAMMITDSSGAAPASVRDATKDFLAPLDDLREKLTSSVVEIKRGEKTVIHATVASQFGDLVTKASELTEPDELRAHFRGKDYPMQIIATDENTDLALIRIKAPGLLPVKWGPQQPNPAKLVFTPLKDRLTYGVITQPSRPALKKGYELNFSSKAPSAYLGVTFSEETNRAVISAIDLDSPADKIGLLEGDDIIKINGEDIETAAELGEAMSKYAPGEKVTLVVQRGEEKVSLRPILDVRKAKRMGTFDKTAARRDDALSSLSSKGGELSERRDGFPTVLYHDQTLRPQDCGTPLFDREGNILGLNISRSLRHRTLAIPAKTVSEVVRKLRR